MDLPVVTGVLERPSHIFGEKRLASDAGADTGVGSVTPELAAVFAEYGVLRSVMEDDGV